MLDAHRLFIQHYFRRGQRFEDGWACADVRNAWRLLAVDARSAYLTTPELLVTELTLREGFVEGYIWHTAASSVPIIARFANLVPQHIEAALAAQPLPIWQHTIVQRVITDQGEQAARLNAPRGQARYTWSHGAVLELDLIQGDIVGSARLYGGREAVKARAHPYPPMPWATAQHDPRSPHRARSLAEALFYVSRHYGTMRDHRRTADGIELLVDAFYGWTIFRFELLSQSTNPTFLGDGLSLIMDPADFIATLARLKHLQPNREYATPLQRRLAARDLRIAASGLRQALRFIPVGADIPPEEGIWHTTINHAMRMTARRHFRQAAITRKIAHTEVLAAGWERLG